MNDSLQGLHEVIVGQFIIVPGPRLLALRRGDDQAHHVVEHLPFLERRFGTLVDLQVLVNELVDPAEFLDELADENIGVGENGFVLEDGLQRGSEFVSGHKKAGRD